MQQRGDERGRLAKCALAKRSAYNISMARPYNAGDPANQALPMHVDATGNWVVLFSFGNTVDFFVGHRAVCIERYDAPPEAPNPPFRVHTVYCQY